MAGTKEIQRTNSRVIRRETHSSRALTTVILALVGLVITGYLVAETIASLVGAGHLLLPANEIWHNALHAPKYLLPWAMVLIGVVLVLIALFLLVKSLAPGTLNRHAVNDNRAAIVADDGVIASAVSKSVRDRFGFEPSQVKTSVDRKHVRVTVTPTSGVQADRGELERHVGKVVSSFNLAPSVSVSVRLTENGVVAG